MGEKEKKILGTFKWVIPHLSDVEKEKLLAFGEGLGFAVNAPAEGNGTDMPAICTGCARRRGGEL